MANSCGRLTAAEENADPEKGGESAKERGKQTGRTQSSWKMVGDTENKSALKRERSETRA